MNRIRRQRPEDATLEWFGNLAYRVVHGRYEPIVLRDVPDESLRVVAELLEVLPGTADVG